MWVGLFWAGGGGGKGGSFECLFPIELYNTTVAIFFSVRLHLPIRFFLYS